MSNCAKRIPATALRLVESHFHWWFIYRRFEHCGVIDRSSFDQVWVDILSWHKNINFDPRRLGPKFKFYWQQLRLGPRQAQIKFWCSGQILSRRGTNYVRANWDKHLLHDLQRPKTSYTWFGMVLNTFYIICNCSKRLLHKLEFSIITNILFTPDWLLFNYGYKLYHM